jgi:hypothetical protein
VREFEGEFLRKTVDYIIDKKRRPFSKGIQEENGKPTYEWTRINWEIDAGKNDRFPVET